MNGVAYWCKSGGLGNRLRALMGYQAMAEILEVPFLLCWEGSWASDSAFGDLFYSNTVRLVTPQEMVEVAKDSGFRVFSENPPIENIWKAELSQSVSWSHYAQKAYKCLAALTPRDELTNIVDEFCRSGDFPTVSRGLHIRWTDNLSAFKTYKNFVPEHASTLRGFERAVESCQQHSPLDHVFLCTDNREVEKDFKRRFPDTILTFPKDYRHRFKWSISLKDMKISKKGQRTSSTSDALVEMLILSRCPMIVGTHHSSFSRMSAIIGGRPYYFVRGEDVVEHDYLTGLLEITEGN